MRELNREGQPQRRTTKQPVAGQTLVTSLDIETQKVAEGLCAKRSPEPGGRAAATGGSVVVMDARNGQIRAMASYPTYDPNIWAKGLSEAEYADLTDKKSGQPLVFRPAQSVAPPASTFKAFTTVAASEAGFDLNGRTTARRCSRWGTDLHELRDAGLRADVAGTCPVRLL